MRFLDHHHLTHARMQACAFSKAEHVASAFRLLDSEWDQCLYLTAHTSISLPVPHPEVDLTSNTIGLNHALEHARIGHPVFVPAGRVYSGCKGLVEPDAPPSPDLPDPISMLSKEDYTRATQAQCGSPMNATIVGFCGAYGPYELACRLYTRAARTPAFVRIPDFTVMGDGNNVIDTMYVDDAIQAFCAFLEHPATRVESVDVAEGAHVTLKKIGTRAAQAFDIAARLALEGESAEYTMHAGAPQTFIRRYGVAPQASWRTD